jgi:hypothetical protein
MAGDTPEAAPLARSPRGGGGASEALGARLGLLLQRGRAPALQQRMAWRQTTPSARLGDAPAHLAVPAAVARAGEGQGQQRERL